MGYLRIAAALVAAPLLIAAGAEPESDEGTPGKSLKYPIYGAWEISKYVLAPWIEPGEDTRSIAAQAEKLQHLVIDFEPGKVVSDDEVLGCTEANYTPTEYPPDYLFQGGLPEGQQAKLAKSYGLPGGNVPGFDLDCSTGVFSYHFANADTLLLAYDDVIYWIDRKKP